MNSRNPSERIDGFGARHFLMYPQGVCTKYVCRNGAIRWGAGKRFVVSTTLFGKYLGMEEPVNPALQHGLVDRKTLEKIRTAFDDWGENADVFAAEAWGEAVPWKS